jgi:hypothetical protein
VIGKGHPFYRLLRRLEVDYLTVLEADAERDFGTAWPAYKAARYVCRTAAAQDIPCPDCDGEALRIIYLRPDVPAIRCPRCGPVTLTMTDVARARIVVPTLLGAIGSAAGTAGAPAEVSPGVWRLGPIRSPARSTDAFVAGTLDSDRVSAARLVVTARRSSVLFFPTAEGLAGWSGTGPTAAALTEYLDVDGSVVGFDHSAFAGLLRGEAAHAPPPRKVRKKRADRAEKIERLTAEVRKHLFLARAHAQATRRRDGVAELLPRPEQRALARAAGLTDADVHRCLHRDESDPARVLQFLWRTAANLDEVLAWRELTGR